MSVRLIDALAITASNGREGRRPRVMPPLPLIILDFPYEVAQAIVRKILIPYVKPEHIFAGYYLHQDGKMTLGCYIVVPVPQSKGEPITYILGTERDFDDEEWALWRERLGEFGKFAVSCGIFTGDPNGSYLTRPEWFVEVPTFYRENVLALLTRRAFGA